MVNCHHFNSPYPASNPQLLPSYQHTNSSWQEVKNYCQDNQISFPLQNQTQFNSLAYAAFLGGPKDLLERILYKMHLNEEVETGIIPPIFAAIFSQNQATLTALLDLKIDIHCHLDGLTALHFAAFQNQSEICKLLINAGLSVDVLRQKVADFSLLESMNLNEMDTPLGVAVQFDAFETVEVLLENGADPTVTKCAISPLELAVKSSPKILELLLNHVKDCNAVFIQGLPLLHFLLANKNNELYLKYFNHFIKQEGVHLNKQDCFGRTLLHLAVKAQSTDLVIFLLEKQVNLNTQTIENEILHETPLHVAINTESEDIALLLLEAGAKTTIMDRFGYTPFMRALLFNTFRDSFIQKIREKDKGYSDELIWIRLFGLRFGLDGLLFEGANGKMTIQEAASSFNAYMQQEAKPDFAEYLTLFDRYLFESNLQDSHVLSKLEKGQPIFLYFHIPFHMMTAVIWRDYFFKCNRSDLSEPGILIYKINKKENMKSFIDQFIKINESSFQADRIEKSIEEGIHFFNKTTNEILDLDLYHYEKNSYQNAGNCAWVAAKMAVKSTFICLGIMQQTSNPKQGIKLGIEEYKKWFVFDRRRALCEMKNKQIRVDFQQFVNLDSLFGQVVEKNLKDKKIDFLDFIFHIHPSLLFFKNPIDGYTWLHQAIHNKQRDVVAYLLDKGLDPNEENKQGESCFLCAVSLANGEQDSSASFEICQQLLKHERHPTNVNQTAKGGLSPLITAVNGGRKNLIKLLLDAEADPYQKCVADSNSLDFAKNQPEIYDLIQNFIGKKKKKEKNLEDQKSKISNKKKKWSQDLFSGK